MLEYHNVKQNKLVASSLIAREFFTNFKNNPKTYLNTVKDNMHSKYGLVLTNSQIYRAYQKALKNINGIHEEKYVILQDYVEKVRGQILEQL